MPVGDFLSKIGDEIASGVGTVGRVAGAVAEPLAKGVINEEAGYAPQIAAESRQHQQQMEDAQLGIKSKVLEGQLGQLQSSAPVFKQDGSMMSPEERSKAISDITDQYTQLYSHPRHAGTLMEKLRQAVHPNGAVAGSNPTTSSPGKVLQPFSTADPNGPKGSEEAEDEKHVKQIDFFKKHMMPLFPPEQQAQKLNQYIDHLNGLKEGAEPKPKSPKIIEQNGLPVGIEGADGKLHTMDELAKPDSDADPEVKALAKSVMDARAKKDAADAKKEQDRRDDENHRNEQSTQRLLMQFRQQSQMAMFQMQKMMEMGDYREARKEVNKAKGSYEASVDRASSMDKAAQKAKQGDQQAMFAVLSNHIAMTLQQPGVSARPTKAMYDEAASSLPWMQNVTKKFDKDSGVLTGLVLTPDQIDKMVDLGHQKVEVQKEHVDRLNDEFKDDLNPTVPGTNRPVKKGGVAKVLGPVGGPGPVNKVGGGSPTPPAGATHIKKYQGKEYWVDGQGNNLGEKK
jgi:hypothetical protein